MNKTKLFLSCHLSRLCTTLKADNRADNDRKLVGVMPEFMPVQLSGQLSMQIYGTFEQ